MDGDGFSSVFDRFIGKYFYDCFWASFIVKKVYIVRVG